MDKVQKIREEVERLQELTMDKNKNFYSEAAEGEYNALCNIEHFINSLQEEPVSEELEEAVKRNRAMSRAEKFISDYTRNCSNQSEWGVETPNKSIIYVQPWLTPDQARRAVEIAREEMIEWLKDNASKYIINTTPSYPDADFSAFVGGKCWEDLKQAMNYE